jgi:hypothetical protein
MGVVEECLNAILTSVEVMMGYEDRYESPICDQLKYELIIEYRKNITAKERGVTFDDEGKLPWDCCCDKCGFTNGVIMGRGWTDEDQLYVDCDRGARTLKQIMELESTVVCYSCSYLEDDDSKVCIDCGVCDNYLKVCYHQFCENWFVECNDGYRCERCMDILSQSNQLTFGPDDTTSDIELTDSEIEYEPDELPENNSEKVVEIKENIKNMGEKLFDIQDKLTEGEYLEMMNLLMVVTRGLNEL